MTWGQSLTYTLFKYRRKTTTKIRSDWTWVGKMPDKILNKMSYGNFRHATNQPTQQIVGKWSAKQMFITQITDLSSPYQIELTRRENTFDAILNTQKF